MIIFINLHKTKGVLGSWKLWFSYINENLKKIKNFSSFLADFQFRAKGKKVTSRAETSWNSFSSSSGSSKLGSDSSLPILILHNRRHCLWIPEGRSLGTPMVWFYPRHRWKSPFSHCTFAVRRTWAYQSNPAGKKSVGFH